MGMSVCFCVGVCMFAGGYEGVCVFVSLCLYFRVWLCDVVVVVCVCGHVFMSCCCCAYWLVCLCVCVCTCWSLGLRVDVPVCQCVVRVSPCVHVFVSV